MIPPRPVSGHDAQASWLERFRQWAVSKQLLPGPGYRLKQTTHGVQLEIIRGPGGGNAVPGPTIQRLNVTALHLSSYYLEAKTLDGVTTLNVALPPSLRASMHASDAIIDIGTVTYDYTDLDTHHRRSASFSSITEVQYITPDYILAGAAGATQILAVNIPSGVTVDDVELDWQELNDARAWAADLYV